MNANYSTAFTTGNIADTIPPNILSRCIQSASNCVPITGTINPVNGLQLIFNESMLTSSVENSLAFTVDTGTEVRTISPTSVTWSNFNKEVLVTYGTVPAGSATISLSNNARDASGNALNTPFTDTFTSGSSNIVDYQVTAASFPLGGTISTAIAGNFTLTNIGNVNGGSNVSWKVYASTDAVYNTGDTLINSGTQPALNGGASINVPFSGTWGATPGSYYLIIVLSGGGDGNSNNNTKVSSAIQVIAPAPDYVVSSTSFPTSGVISSALSGNFVITNIGVVNGGNIVNWYVYSSADNVYDAASDTQIAFGTQTQLNAGISSVSIPFNGT
ncbi:MAG: hypothetical protein OEV44_05545 [Spirochaetota bacterium]|nr:hypothetical protein [Spirochaetota bacterium]